MIFPASKSDNINNGFSFPEDILCGQRDPFSDISLSIEDLVIPWSELAVREKIGAGMFYHRNTTFQMYLGV